MATMPQDSLARGEPRGRGAPAKRSSPASGRTAPLRILSKVDFPAPFSPTIAWTSPDRTSRSTPARASTPAYRFTRLRTLSKDSMVAFHVGGEMDADVARFHRPPTAGTCQGKKPEPAPRTATGAGAGHDEEIRCRIKFLLYGGSLCSSFRCGHPGISRVGGRVSGDSKPLLRKESSMAKPMTKAQTVTYFSD